MLQHCHKFHISDAFHIFFDLAVDMFRFAGQSRSSSVSQCVRTMNSVFKIINNMLSRNFSRAFETNIELNLEPVEQYLVPYFHLLTSALLPRTFWIHLHQQAKQKILLQLSSCLQLKEFRKMENQTLEMFERICGLLDFDELLDEVSKIASFIILSHELGEKSRPLLTLKFNHYLLIGIRRPDRVCLSKLLL